MELTRITALDLRSREVIEEERLFRAVDKMWDFPQCPIYVPTPKLRTINVMFTADDVDFHEAMDRMMSQIKGAQRLVTDTWGAFLSETYQGGEFTWEPYGRWNLRMNWPVYALSIGITLFTFFVLGSWLWG